MAHFELPIIDGNNQISFSIQLAKGDKMFVILPYLQRTFIKKTIVVSVLLALPLCLTLMAQAARVDCKKPDVRVEKIICDDDELLELDRMMAASFRQALQAVSKADRQDIIRGQDTWLSKRNRCEDTECLKVSYEKRITALDDIIIEESRRIQQDAAEVSKPTKKPQK
jgi:uncharacterized protein